MEFNREHAIPDDAATPIPFTETTGQSEHSHGIDELQSGSLTFVSDLDVPEVQIQGMQQLDEYETCLLYTSPSPRDGLLSRMPSSA